MSTPGGNRIILGLMTFGPDTRWGARTTSIDEFKDFLDAFQAEGYNEVDTARLYQNGQQEAFTAAAGWKDRGLKLATKLYPIKGGMHRASTLRDNVEESLRQLQTNHVDIFYLHAADRSTPFVETLETVNKLYKAGKIREFGLSNFTSFEVAEIVITCSERGWIRPTIYQAMYNALTRSIESELIPACRRYGLDVVVYNPLAGGLFTGKLSAATIAQPGRGQELTQVDKTYRARYLRDASFEALAVIEPVVKSHNLTLIETAFRWLLHHSSLKMGAKGTDGILIGASSLAQLKNNCVDLKKGPLPEEVVEALDQAWTIAKTDTSEYWHLKLEYSYDTVKEIFSKA